MSLDKKNLREIFAPSRLCGEKVFPIFGSSPKFGSSARIVCLAFAAALAAGCATEPAPTAAAPGVNLSGYPPAFRAGYADGCGSVNAARKRDEPRFKSDADYAQGWRDGYDVCLRRK